MMIFIEIFKESDIQKYGDVKFIAVDVLHGDDEGADT